MGVQISQFRLQTLHRFNFVVQIETITTKYQLPEYNIFKYTIGIDLIKKLSDQHKLLVYDKYILQKLINMD